jgi:hypothetical protein
MLAIDNPNKSGILGERNDLKPGECLSGLLKFAEALRGGSI